MWKWFILGGTAAVMLFVLVASLVFPGLSIGSHSREIGQNDMTCHASQSGEFLVFNARGAGGRDLYLLNLTNSQVSRIAETPEYETDPCFTPDGRSVVYAAGVPGDRADHIFGRSVDGTAVKQLTRSDGNDCTPCVSPDGKCVAFVRDKTYNWGGLAASWSNGGVICMVDIDGSNERQLTDDEVFAYNPHFSVDGQSVVYSTANGRFSVPIDGTRAAAQVSKDSEFVRAAPSFDRKRVTYTRGKTSPNQTLFVSNADGTDERKVLSNPGPYYAPQFLPSGNELILFQEEWPDGPSGEPAHSLWKVDVDGKNLRLIADRSLFDSPLTWKPETKPE